MGFLLENEKLFFDSFIYLNEIKSFVFQTIHLKHVPQLGVLVHS